MIVELVSDMMTRWNSALDRFDPKGVSQEHATNIRMANSLNLVTAAGCLIFGGMYAGFGFYFEAVMLALGFFAFLGLARHNSKSRDGNGRLLFSLLSNAILFILADSFGREAGVQWCFFAGSCLSYIVYSKEEVRQRMLATSLPIFCYALLEVTGYDFILHEQISLETQKLISQAVIPFVFLSLILSLSQRHKANDAFAEELQSDRELSELRFSAVYENAPVMISSFDSFGRPILWNKTCHEKTGYGFQELQSHPGILSSLFGGENTRAGDLQVFQNIDGQFREYMVHTKSRSIASHMWANFRLPDNKIISVGYDVTDLKMAREELKRANEELETKVALRTSQLEETTKTLARMGSEIDDVFWTRNGASFDFEYVSPASQKVWGLRPEQLLESSDALLRVIHPDDLKLYFEKCKCALRPPYEKFEVEFRIQKNSEVRWVWSRCFPILDSQGQLSQIYGVTTDVTERKKTQEILEQQKIQMISSARLAALGEMSSGIAHEVNNPLTIIHMKAGQIRSLSEDASENPLLEKISGHAMKIEQTADRIAKIVRSLRQFARDGSTDPFVPAPLKTIIDDTLELCLEKILNRNVKIEISSLHEDWMLECRSTELAQVFLNLLMNSLDAVSTQEDKWIRLKVEDLSEAYRVSVTDSGPGIPEAIREKIMHPFFTTKDVGQGTGLGLSISKGIVESHQGVLKLDESSPNTCFQVTLPKRHRSKTSSPEKAA